MGQKINPIGFRLSVLRNAGKLLEEKAEFLARAAASGGPVVFEHDPSVPASIVQRDAAGRFSAGPALDL